MPPAPRKSPGQPKALRLGVIHEGKIVEEKVLRKRRPVVIG